MVWHRRGSSADICLTNGEYKYDDGTYNKYYKLEITGPSLEINVYVDIKDLKKLSDVLKNIK